MVQGSPEGVCVRCRGSDGALERRGEMSAGCGCWHLFVFDMFTFATILLMV